MSELQERIRHACIHQRLSDMTNLIQATQLLSAYHGCIATTLTLIIEGELRAYLEVGQKIGRILVAEIDLHNWLVHQKQERELVTRQYIADKFGVKLQTVTTWVESGLIQPFQKNDYRMHFKKQDADNFSAQFIFSEDTAEILQRYFRWVD